MNNVRETAATVVQKTEYAYSTTSRYLDSGKLVVTVTNALKTPTSTAIYYRTAYTTKGPFNFEFYKLGQSNSLFIVNRDNVGNTNCWWGINDKTRKYDHLLDALAEAQGISTLTSTMIPKFLFARDGKRGPNLFKEMYDLILLQQENINGIECYKISASYKTGSAIVWIGQTDFLIRKVEMHQIMKGIDFLTEYFITPYQTTNDAEFRFRPNRSIKV